MRGAVVKDVAGAPRRGSSTVKRALRTVGLLFAACCIAAVAILVYLCAKSPTARETVGVLVTRDYRPEKAFPNRDEVNILLMGRDLDRDPHGRVVHTRGRTDAMMIAHVDFRDGSASVLSIPRDILVRIPGYRGKRRVSYANSYGGPDLAQDTVRELLGVRPDHYVLLNFEGFEKAIDALGGLDLTVDKQLDYDDNWGNLHIHLKPGQQHLNGYQAMGFVRFRKSNTGIGDSDLVRIGRQQELLRAARAKLSSPGVAFKVPHVLDIIREDMEGNLTPAQMMCLACFLKSLPPDRSPRMESLPSKYGGGVFVRVNPQATAKLVRQMFFDNRQ